jgi:glycosyltransferase involved in cell wall biosynthesis
MRTNSVSQNLQPPSPLISVVIPVFNARPFLRLAVLSIIAQSFKDWELFVIDDGSTDGGLESISDITDERIYFLQDHENKGLSIRLNQAMDLARGIYFARMDADDVSFPDRFALQLGALTQDPALDLVATRVITINSLNQFVGFFPGAIEHSTICARPWRGFYFPHPTWMGRTEWFRRHRYAIPAPFCCEDQELLLRSYSESKFRTVDKILLAYRLPAAVNLQKRLLTRRATYSFQRQYFLSLGRWLDLALAAVSLVLKIGLDVSGVRRRIILGDDQTMEKRWMEVLATVRKEPHGVNGN